MKILTVLTAWLVLCPLVEARQGNVPTGADSHRAAAREFIEASGARRSGAENFQSAMSGAIANMPADRAAIQERFLPRMAEALAEITESDEYLESMVDGYVEVFTEEELRSLTAMFRSPIGQTYVERMPALAQAAARATQQVMPRMMETFQAIAREMAQERGRGARGRGALPGPSDDQ